MATRNQLRFRALALALGAFALTAQADPTRLNLWTIAVIDALCADIDRFDTLMANAEFQVTHVQLDRESTRRAFRVTGHVYREGDSPSVALHSGGTSEVFLARTDIRWDPGADGGKGPGTLTPRLLNAIAFLDREERQRLFTPNNRVTRIRRRSRTLEIQFLHGGWPGSAPTSLFLEEARGYLGPCTGPRIYRAWTEPTRDP
jgi:hypothetical protein